MEVEGRAKNKTVCFVFAQNKGTNPSCPSLIMQLSLFYRFFLSLVFLFCQFQNHSFLSDYDMSEKVFFTKHFISKEIELPTTEGRWALVAKLDEIHSQFDAWGYEELRGPSSACGFFQCVNFYNPDETATMKHTSIWLSTSVLSISIPSLPKPWTSIESQINKRRQKTTWLLQIMSPRRTRVANGS